MSNEPRDDEYIEICDLELMATIGVPDAERAQPQRLTISIKLWPRAHFSTLVDDVANAVDYAAVCRDVKEFVSRREDRLIETLASRVAEHLLGSYPITRVEIELRKFVLPDARHTAVSLVRSRACTE